MNQSKFSLADIITLLASLVFGFFCFLSLNFLSLGDTNKSLIFSLAIAVILFALTYGAKLLKSTDHNFKRRIIWEWVLLFIFLCFAIIFILWPFSHFFAVSAQKDALQSELNKNIIQAESMYEEYDNYANTRIAMYESTLKSVVAAKNNNPKQYTDYRFENGVNDNNQIKNKVGALKKNLQVSSDIRENNGKWMGSAKNAVKSWNPISIVNVVNNLDTKVNEWKCELVEKSKKFRADGEVADDFECETSFNSVKDSFTKLGKPNIVSILVAIGLYLLMLLSYFLTKRHPRYPGLKVLFSSHKNDNEL